MRGVQAVAALVLVTVLSGTTGGIGSADAPAPSRVAATDGAVAQAIAVSQATFADGEALGVVLARDDVFTDALAGVTLAGTQRAVLYVPGGAGQPLPDDVGAEIQRLVGDRRCTTGVEVFLLGGTAAVSTAVEQSLAARDLCPTRVAGRSRVETAAAVAAIVRARGGSDHVLVATAADWADSAAGGAWAARTGAALLVTTGPRLHPAAAAELTRRSPGTVTVLGGAAAVSDATVTDLQALAGRVQRIAGPDRAGTAAGIARQLWDDTDGWLLVNGYTGSSWQLALAAGVLAARTGAAQLYADVDTLPRATTDLLHDCRLLLVVGPTSLVSERLATEARGPTVCGADPRSGPAPAPWDGAVPDIAVLHGEDPLAALNWFRHQAGMTRLAALDPEVSDGAARHSRYTVEESDPGHDEDPGSPWSSPSSRGEVPPWTMRVYFPGFGVGEEVAAITAWMRTPFHGDSVLTPFGERFGIGAHTDDAAPGFPRRATTMRAAGWLFPTTSGAALLTYPADGRSLATTSFWPGGEHPDPLGPCGYALPAGQPVWVTTDTHGVQVLASALRDAAGTDVAHCAFAAGPSAFLLPRDPLAPGGVYSASVTSHATSWGSPLTTAWSFRVVPDPLDR